MTHKPRRMLRLNRTRSEDVSEASPALLFMQPLVARIDRPEGVLKLPR